MEGAQEPEAKHAPNLSDAYEVCCSSEISDLLLKGLKEQSQKGLSGDVVLIADGMRFTADRKILAACSNYFNSMFTLGMQESYQKEVELVGASSIGCKAVLDFLYGNEPLLDSINIYCILKTAHLLQIWKLVDTCCEYLASELNEENYFQLQELASAYSLERLDSFVDDFILKHFGRLSFTFGFIEKVSVKKLCLYLDSDQVQQKVEHDLLEAALKWLSHCPERAKEARRVLQKIRFSLIPKSDLINLVNPAKASLILPQQMNWHSFIAEAIHYHKKVTARPVLHNRRSTLRGDGERLLFLGGGRRADYPMDAFVMKNHSLYFLDPKRGKWISETTAPTNVGDCCVAVLGNFIFCAGVIVLDEEEQRMVYRYDPRCKRWTEVAPMNHGREFLYLAALEDRLVAVGGAWMDTDILSSVEMYYPQLDSWSFVAELPRPTYCHAGTTFEQCIYISGGTSEPEGRASSTLLCYDYHADTWQEKKNMDTSRVHHGMCTFNGRIYAIGGRDTAQGPLDYDAIRSVECYSPVCDQWTYIAPLLKAASHLGAAVWRGEIYVIAAENSNGVSLFRVEVYDHENDDWNSRISLQGDTKSVSACVCVLRSKTSRETIDPK